ncbi:MAG: hypothetical protein EYC69_05465 [Bacteroidetes bacterium]|nr:MAG: hypothetical protein EYC69_05465 [Bacteroidota bacterium]
MKNYLLIILPLALLVGCENYKEENEQLKQERESLVSSAAYKDSTITNFLTDFNEIEENLKEVSQRQDAIAENSSSGELKSTQIERIRENINAINALMQSNKDKIAELSKQLKNSNYKIKGLDKMLASLNEQLAEKDAQLAGLNTELASLHTKVDMLNTNIDSLTADNQQKQGTIEDQTIKIQKAFVVTGTSKELLQKQVIVKEGGFLGIGKEEKLKGVVNKDAFETIDVTKTSIIPIHAKNVELLTYHDANSYNLQRSGKEVSDLVITDPDKFWAGSKYLVVMLDK